MSAVVELGGEVRVGGVLYWDPALSCFLDGWCGSLSGSLFEISVGLGGPLTESSGLGTLGVPDRRPTSGL